MNSIAIQESDIFALTEYFTNFRILHEHINSNTEIKESFLKRYFFGYRDEAHWNFAVYYIYCKVDFKEVDKEFVEKYLEWFTIFFKDWKKANYIIEAIAFRLLYDITKIDIFQILDSRRSFNSVESEKKLLEYIKKVKY